MIKIGRMDRVWAAVLSLLFVTVFSWVSWANEVQVDAYVDSNQVEKGEVFILTVSVSASKSVAVNEPRLPDLRGFELLGTTSSTSSQSSFANGKFSVKITKNFIYQLVAVREGKLRIGAIDVAVEGRMQKTQPIVMDIRKQSVARKNQRNDRRRVRPRQMRDPFEEMEDAFSQLLQRRPRPGYRSPPGKGKESFFIQVEVDKTDVYVGEQVTASWYLYTRAAIRDIDTLKYPSLKGFWKEDIEVATSLRFENEIVNGVVYQKALLASYALFPIKKGVAVIDPYKAKCTVAERGTFGFGRSFVRTKGSRSVKVNVKELPVAGRPNDFTGAVGQFQVSSKLEPNTPVPANQPVTLKIRVAGRGNGKMVELPELALPESLELYDTKKEAQFFKDGRSYKDFEVLLIPRQEGQIEIPASQLSFFDPDKGEYYSRTTPALNLSVTPDKTQKTMDSVPVAGAGDPGEVRRGPDLVLSWQEASVLSFPHLLGLWGGAFLLSFLLLTWRGFVEFGWGQKKKDLEKVIQSRIKEVHKHVDRGDWRAVGVELTNIFYFLLGALSGGGANVELSKMIQKLPPSVRRELGGEIEKLMGQLDIISFAPEGVVGSMKEPPQLKETVKQADKLLNRTLKLASAGGAEK